MQTVRGRIIIPSEVNDIVDISCFIGFNSLAPDPISNLIEPVREAFKKDDSVTVGTVDLANFVWKPGRPLQFGDDKKNDADIEIAIFPKRKVDRTCLLPTFGKPYPVAEAYTGVPSLQNVVEFVNSQCNTYSNGQGGMSMEGLHRQEILKTFYHVSDHTDVKSSDVFNDIKVAEPQNCLSDSCDEMKDESTQHKDFIHVRKSNTYQEKCSIDNCQSVPSDIKMHSCEKIPMPSKYDFFHNYLKISKPVIITGALDTWQALSKWTNTFFRDNYGDRKVHIKLTPDGNFEGVELASLFENYETFKIPASVYKQLPYPDLVVVRPATANMNISEFIDIIEHVSNGSRKGFSGYLEYSSIADIIPELETDIDTMPFFDNMLKLEHTNIWLSDGNTLGKLHFDPFDNFLCQLSGKKEVILFEPHDNTQLYEAHIPEAMLYYNISTRTFYRKELVDTTSMVMSPVDILKPNYQRFPKFADTYPMNCTISEGEVLFMPAFWWHEVQSHPNRNQGRNLAVNYWYEPFLTKEFPCAECPMDINPKYRHLL